jgi:regulatory protein
MIYREVIDKMQKWCAYQDRSQQQVKQHLARLGVFAEDADAVLVELIGEGFVDEERFARSFARGKFRIKRWGRIKIRQELRLNGVPEKVIALGLKEIDDDEYQSVIEQLVLKEVCKEASDYYRIKNKLYGKGFEPEQVELILKQLKKPIENDFGFEE